MGRTLIVESRSATREPWAESRGKRLLDVIGALILGVACLPLAGIGLAMAWFADGSPVLFQQTRVGREEELFTIYKFRTMSLDASKLDGERITALGRFMRASSIDELPQIYSILRGDMSFVGPRPLLPEYLPYYSTLERKRHRVRPGLTGLAQASGRNALGWNERLRLDVEYVESATALIDLRVLARSVFAVLSGRGVSMDGQTTMHRLNDVRTEDFDSGNGS